jgi:hypothetical protein
VSILRWRLEDAGGGYGRAVGEVRNDGGEPVRVVLKLVARDDAGHAIATKDIYPSGTQAISAGKTWPFESVFQLRPGTYAEATLEVVDVEPMR